MGVGAPARPLNPHKPSVRQEGGNEQSELTDDMTNQKQNYLSYRAKRVYLVDKQILQK